MRKPVAPPRPAFVLNFDRSFLNPSDIPAHGYDHQCTVKPVALNVISAHEILTVSCLIC